MRLRDTGIYEYEEDSPDFNNQPAIDPYSSSFTTVQATMSLMLLRRAARLEPA